VPVKSLLVVHDDLDLPLGRVRFRGRGSSGGHRGIASIIEAFSTDDFARLKVGVGRPEAMDAADYVLAPLRGEEEKKLLEIASRAAETLPVWLSEGTESCANRYNGASFT
jgi:PTH1 family peptidyl-tRNA hydrolase